MGTLERHYIYDNVGVVNYFFGPESRQYVVYSSVLNFCVEGLRSLGLKTVSI